MKSNLKLATPNGYTALTPDTAIEYAAGNKKLSERLGGASSSWQCREVGDGNLNLVFILEGLKGAFVIKQALPYVRLVGESWPLPLSRAHFEYAALVEESKWANKYVPEIYHHDHDMALTAMEFLSPHIILRKGLVRGIEYPHMARHLGEFLAATLFYTSDLYLDAPTKKQKIADYLTNTAMCKISEDLIFDEPYFDAPMNRHTPALDDIAAKFKKDAILKSAVQNMKWKFLNAPEALLHGDLHTGSVMVTETDTRAIDPEFAFYGPMGFDIGAVLANLFMAYFAQSGHETKPGERKQYADWILRQAEIVWKTFEEKFTALWRASHKGDVYQSRLLADSPELIDHMIQNRMNEIWNDTLGFAGCKIIRRILGLAHVEDFEAIADEQKRAAGEYQALVFARELLTSREAFKTMSDVTAKAQ